MSVISGVDWSIGTTPKGRINPTGASDVVTSTVNLAPPSSTPQTVVADMQSYARILATGSTASLNDKVAAFAAYNHNLQSSSGWFSQGTQAERDAVRSAVEGSEFVKQAYAAVDQFSNLGNSLSAPNSQKSSKSEYDRFMALSESQQQLVYAGGFSTFNSLGDFISYLKASTGANTATTSAPASPVTITLSDQAKIALGDATEAGPNSTSKPTTDSNSSAEQALKNLVNPSLTTSDADVGLALLQSIAKEVVAGADGKSKNAASPNITPSQAGTLPRTTQNAYAPGSVVNATA